MTGPDGTRSYAYDPVGNRSSRVLSGTTTTYAYDRADRISAAGPTSITVNANGNTTARGPDTFSFDQPNRLKTATVAGTTETYVYDGDGVRFSRQVGAGGPIRYVSDVNRNLPVTIDDGTHKYVYGLGLAYAVAGSTVEVYHPDRLGSTRAITDAAGAVTATYRTDEWGTPTTTTGSSSQPFRFTGEPLDATGLTYLRARYYDPALGRLASRDPISGRSALPRTLNRYVYTLDNPVSLTDCSGKTSSSKVLAEPSPTPRPGFPPPSLQPSQGAENPSACIIAAYGSGVLSDASLGVGAGGLILLGGGATTIGATLGLGTPPGLAEIGAGLLLELIAAVGEVTAVGLLLVECG